MQESNAIKTSRKIRNVHGYGVITDWHEQNCFAKFHSRETLKDERRPQDIHQTLMIKSLVKSNPW